ncbi:helix-turn-helix transcriptional regulator [uncultured Pelagimonas sp.]|uniref:helix-turn-helix transcriptional regulator n=1 Tax=uncultured Pelagimonas sp. TaxID=1618102 RepID=UPI0026074353|nr:helix-turn-helix transcriptional regulator [uncultured Pelagimonas sp.]
MTKFDGEDWSAKIKEYRKIMRITQVDLAATIGVDTMTVSRWERGKVLPSIRQQAKLKDLMLIGSSAAQHPLIRQLKQLPGSVSVVGLHAEKYLYSIDPDDIMGFGKGDRTGINPMQDASEYARDQFSDVGGFLGIIRDGYLGYEFVTKRTVGGEVTKARTLASVVRMSEFEPLIVITRELVHPDTPAFEMRITREDDLFD